MRYVSLLLFAAITFAQAPLPPATGITARVDPISQVKLGKGFTVELVNVHVCNFSAVEMRDFAQERIWLDSDFTPLTKGQATWFLTQKQTRSWPTMVERIGTEGLVVAALQTSPYTAVGISVLQSIIDAVKAREPNIAPFLADLLPDLLDLKANGGCVTGSALTVIGCYNPKICGGALPMGKLVRNKVISVR